ncbi:hypothetical protein Mapa_017562 [Marchantia paleacea]|nr:hypothetical protein Mapa_017562 [Marchantia paleacea]
MHASDGHSARSAALTETAPCDKIIQSLPCHRAAAALRLATYGASSQDDDEMNFPTQPRPSC